MVAMQLGSCEKPTLNASSDVGAGCWRRFQAGLSVVWHAFFDLLQLAVLTVVSYAIAWLGIRVPLYDG